ncbi:MULTISPECIES: RusA family crossover junction endodeoxyribonuclease [unclassified Klebsiella]|uniref:RusA family crossover junction endodeoxyribonuclease n=1 Tax=unclassified Klebsiella TaxID=2608929 RepID=UPI000C2B1E82|nr:MULTISPECIES: RusA family crossover junction endodeoxyribonuclease [unclassified Klebsiella]PJX56623.1 RusA family crossover junction endodeoxyribonuclease [Klebsiella sp. F-Nf9]PKJ70407.1 RusA family crossover junction endodeoxyribonuclease [Klebsiella sp. X1-16S-Nf21]
MQIFNITPMGKPRQTRADKWKQREVVLRYRALCDEVCLKKVTMLEAGSHITFILPMPASWSQKKRAVMNGKAHQQKPDVDNMIKALVDALYANDAHIWDLRVTKLWGVTGQILISDSDSVGDNNNA